MDAPHVQRPVLAHERAHAAHVVAVVAVLVAAKGVDVGVEVVVQRWQPVQVLALVPARARAAREEQAEEGAADPVRARVARVARHRAPARCGRLGQVGVLAVAARPLVVPDVEHGARLRRQLARLDRAGVDLRARRPPLLPEDLLCLLWRLGVVVVVIARRGRCQGGLAALPGHGQVGRLGTGAALVRAVGRRCHIDGGGHRVDLCHGEDGCRGGGDGELCLDDAGRLPMSDISGAAEFAAMDPNRVILWKGRGKLAGCPTTPSDVTDVWHAGDAAQLKSAIKLRSRERRRHHGQHYGKDQGVRSSLARACVADGTTRIEDEMRRTQSAWYSEGPRQLLTVSRK